MAGTDQPAAESATISRQSRSAGEKEWSRRSACSSARCSGPRSIHSIPHCYNIPGQPLRAYGLMASGQIEDTISHLVNVVLNDVCSVHDRMMAAGILDEMGQTGQAAAFLKTFADDRV